MNFLKKGLKLLVGEVAPTIASAFGGPFAGMAVRKLSQALFGKDDATQAEIETELAIASPETLLKLKTANQEFQVEMKKLDIDVDRISAGDRDSARKREIALRDSAPKILACVIVAGFFTVLGAMMFVEIPVQAVQPVNILLGALTIMLSQVGNYYFGSSAGSKSKHETISNLINKQVKGGK
jgi:hypothetical protein